MDISVMTPEAIVIVVANSIQRCELIFPWESSH